jgi:hypothetical protein
MAREILAEVGEEVAAPDPEPPDAPHVEKEELIPAVDAAE